MCQVAHPCPRPRPYQHPGVPLTQSRVQGFTGDFYQDFEISKTSLSVSDFSCETFAHHSVLAVNKRVA